MRLCFLSVENGTARLAQSLRLGQSLIGAEFVASKRLIRDWGYIFKLQIQCFRKAVQRLLISHKVASL